MASQKPQASRHEPQRETTPETGRDDAEQSGAEPPRPWHGPSSKPAMRPRPTKDKPIYRDWASI